jgi:hypothetical protein
MFAKSSAHTVNQIEADLCVRGLPRGMQVQPSFSSHAMLLYQQYLIKKALVQAMSVTAMIKKREKRGSMLCTGDYVATVNQ